MNALYQLSYRGIFIHAIAAQTKLYHSYLIINRWKISVQKLVKNYFLDFDLDSLLTLAMTKASINAQDTAFTTKAAKKIAATVTNVLPRSTDSKVNRPAAVATINVIIK